MPAAIDFFFDFASPYGYLGSLRIDAVAARHGRDVVWRPFMLGAAFKETGMRPLLEQPLRGAYSRHDWLRTARRLGVPFRLPEGFPMAALAPSRAFYFIAERDAELAKAFAARVFHAYFGEGRDMSRPEAVAAEAMHLGLPAAEVLEAMKDARWKQHLKDATAAALARGVFGSPFFVVDDEPFWGNDKIPEIENWLESGGW